MKKGIILILFFLTSYAINAQFGVRFSAQQNDYTNWNTIVSSASTPANADLFNTSYEVGIDYWFRLKNTRVEFFPEVGLGYSSTDNSPSGNDAFPESYNLKQVYAGLNTHIYFLDLQNDCKCPTFSKQNDFVKKGLFLLLASKAHYQQKETVYNTDNLVDNDIALELSAGIGLDIGINDLITISPFGAVSYYPSTQWDGINVNHGIINILPPDETTSNLAFKVGVRIGFRPDYLKNN